MSYRLRCWTIVNREICHFQSWSTKNVGSIHSTNFRGRFCLEDPHWGELQSCRKRLFVVEAFVAFSIKTITLLRRDIFKGSCKVLLIWKPCCETPFFFFFVLILLIPKQWHWSCMLCVKFSCLGHILETNSFLLVFTDIKVLSKNITVHV